jgi:protein TonB
MNSHNLVVLFFGLALSLAPATVQGQASENSRRIVHKLVPNYPELAKKMNMTGTVKVLATVAPDGTVRRVDAMGGNPLLIKATEDALYKWRFASAAVETKELIELHFNPQP